ncbi:nitrogenase iron-molybdenum cofactor biosynthesis protein NifN [Celerinatantimonas yamalensis]|uniref:Nitrogenase iron-molybdenum cofactor biosynthesis protein NifN n=1 Tax=Celerinatantimonas yamalensis TaxID=559956 RepID=A0ABW9G3V7_9GAMM
MADVIPIRKPLSISPLKTSQVLGATIATLGLSDSMALMHSAQGCSAFAKAFFVRHYQEPVALQSTAMDPISTIMGSDGNVKKALDHLAQNSSLRVVVVMSNGLSEAQGTDLTRALREFRDEYPQHHKLTVLVVNTPDFYGSLESGYSAVVEAVVRHYVSDTASEPRVKTIRKKRINLLVGHGCTAADIEALQRLIEAFGLKATILPDISESLDGHLADQDYSSVSMGGTPLQELPRLTESIATIAVGFSVYRAGKYLAQHSEVPSFYFDHLGDLVQCDRFIELLIELSDHAVPEYINRERRQLQDALLDCHSVLNAVPIALAAEPELLSYWLAVAHMVGLQEQVVMAPSRYSQLVELPCEQVLIGDFSDLHQQLLATPAQLLIANSHAQRLAEQLSMSLILSGFPIFDHFGGFRQRRQLYAGVRDTLFELANQVHLQMVHRPVYHSPLKQSDVNDC